MWGRKCNRCNWLQQIDDMTHYPNNDNLRSIWQWLYEGINRANYMQENKSLLRF